MKHLVPLAALAFMFCSAETSRATPVQVNVQQTFTGVYTPTATESNGFLLYDGVLGTQTLPAGAQVLFATAQPPPTVNSFTKSVTVPVGTTDERASVFSVFDTVNGYISIALDNAVAAGFTGANASFTSAFPNSPSTESQLAAALMAGDAAGLTALKAFYTTFRTDFPSVVVNSPVTGTIVNFGFVDNTLTFTRVDSAAIFQPAALVNSTTNGGNVSLLATVPEPGGIRLTALAGAALLGAAAWKKRRAAAAA